MSPGLARSGFESEKRKARAPVGSSAASWDLLKALTGSEQVLRMEGGDL